MEISKEIDLLYELPPPRTFYKRAGKRACDFLFALFLLLALLPLLLLILVLLVIFQGGNPFFLQKRIGRRCEPFHIIKFRTMSNARDAAGNLLPDEERTTLVGKFLRASSLDELPELLNVLKGDMSFIGPRPWIPEQMDTFDRVTRTLRMRIRPGISGLAQVRGRNNLTFRQRVAWDLRYARKLSIWLDVKILFLTFWKVALSEGIAQRVDALGPVVPSAAPKDIETRGLRGNKPRQYTKAIRS